MKATEMVRDHVDLLSSQSTETTQRSRTHDYSVSEGLITADQTVNTQNESRSMKFQCLKHKDDPTPDRFDNTWLDDRVRIPYLLYVWFRAAFFTFTLIESIITSYLKFDDQKEPEKIYKYFIYLTNNGRWLAILTFTFEAVLVSRRCLHEIRGTYKIQEKSKLPAHVRIFWFLSNCNSSLSVLITVVYWVTIYSPVTSTLDFGNFSGHLLIAVSNIIDVFISDRVWQVKHFYHPLIFASVYLLFSIIYFLAGGTNYHEKPFIYAILDYTKIEKTIVWLLLVVLFVFLVHLIFYGFYRLRWIIKRKYLLSQSSKADDVHLESFDQNSV